MTPSAGRIRVRSLDDRPAFLCHVGSDLPAGVLAAGAIFSATFGSFGLDESNLCVSLNGKSAPPYPAWQPFVAVLAGNPGHV